MRERTAERSAACATCGKTFARSDTLLRHEKSHLATEDRGPVHRVTNGTFRACCSCAQARSRCSGGSPCGRCKVRSLECVYPVKRRKVNTGPEDSATPDQKAFSAGPLVRSEPSTSTRHPAPQFQELVFSSTAEDSTSEVTPPQPESSEQAQSASISHETSQPKPVLTGVEYSSNLNQPMLQNQGISMSSMTGYAGDMAQRDQYANNMQSQVYQANLNAQVASFAYDPTYDESINNLNWIPLSVYPSPYGDLDQDFAFLIPPMSDSPGVGTPFEGGQYDAVPRAPTSVNADMHMTRATPESNGSHMALGFVNSPASSTSEGLGTVRSSYGDGHLTEPKRKRKRSAQIQDIFSKPRPANDCFAFPSTPELSTPGDSQLWCSESQYFSLRQAFGQLCMHNGPFKPFVGHLFPDVHAINACLHLYFEHFHTSFPLLHRPTFGPETPWCVVLAVATVGSNFAPVANSAEFKGAFQEFLRRAIATLSEDEAAFSRQPQLTQARILNLISVAQSDRIHLQSLAPKYHAELSQWCLESGLLQVVVEESPISKNQDPERLSSAWSTWVQQETSRRIGYFIWLLDCAYGYMCNTRPLCNMDDARAPLPCPETLWEAPNAFEWAENKIGAPPIPSLCAALEEMYGTKKVMSGLSEVSYILLIHALYSRTWEVGTHIKQPLSEWRSTGNARGFLNTPSKDDFWLPLYPLYANWRNSACDCLDVLHWQASGTVAQASGTEHHGVLQLHLARIILLTPFQELQDLIFFKIEYDVGEESKATYYVHDGSYQRRNKGKADQIRKITRRWLCEDQHKARLAMIHAGSVFWHVKRYSSNSFFEPLAVYLASIVLWTYGSYKSAALEREANTVANTTTNGHQVQDMNVQPSRVELMAAQRSPHNSRSTTNTHYSSPSDVTQMSAPRSVIPSDTGPPRSISAHPESNPALSIDLNAVGTDASDEEEEDDEQDQPQFIHLDRPCDDEIVQHFVRNGHNMAGHMSNVGDICKTPNKVLLEGAKLLKSKLGSWGVSRRYYEILIQVAEGKVGNFTAASKQNAIS